MAKFDADKVMGVEYVRQVRAKLLEDEPETYVKFQGVLRQFRLRNIDSSTAVAAIHKILHNHPDLLLAFTPFLPNNYSAAAAADGADFRACVDFLNRVRTSFPGNGGVYNMLLDCMRAYSKGELTVSGVCDQAVAFFGKHPDMAAAFECMLPEYSCFQERSRKRKTPNPRNNDNHHHHQIPAAPPPRPRRRRKPPRKPERIISNDEAIDFELEDSLSYVEVQIGNLISTLKSAVELARRICSGDLSPADARFKYHFTPLNLVCIRELYKEFLVNEDNPGAAAVAAAAALPELMKRLMKKKKALEKSRAELTEKWIKIRQSRSLH